MVKEGLKIRLDIVLTVLLMFCMGIQLWPLLAHEIAGTLMFICLGLHTWLNWPWYRGLMKGRYTIMRLVILAIAVLLWLDMLVLFGSSLAISYYVFRYLPSPVGISLGRSLHLAASYWALVLTGIHLGIHWSKIAGRIQVDWHSVTGWIIRGIGFLIPAYGFYCFYQLGWWNYLWLEVQFVSFDGIESPWTFYPACLCIIGGWIWMGYYGTKALRWILRS